MFSTMRKAVRDMGLVRDPSGHEYQRINPSPSRLYRKMFGDWRAQMVPSDMRNPQYLTVLPASIYSVPNWTEFAAELRGVAELVKWTLYAYKAYATGGYTQRIFFDENEGNATNLRADTNMKVGGQLPGNEMMVVTSLRLVGIPSATDVNGAAGAAAVAFLEWYRLLHTNAWTEITVSNKLYQVLAPLSILPPGFGSSSIHTVATATVTNVGFFQPGGDIQAVYIEDPPLVILNQRPFNVTCRWGATQAVTTAGRFGPAFDGWMLRSAQ